MAGSDWLRSALFSHRQLAPSASLTTASPKIRPGIGRVARQNPSPFQAGGTARGGACFSGAGPVTMAQTLAPVGPSQEACDKGRREGDILLRVLPKSRGATIPGTQRRPGQTGQRARGSTVDRPPTRHTPPTPYYLKSTPFSSFRVPQRGMRAWPLFICHRPPNCHRTKGTRSRRAALHYI